VPSDHLVTVGSQESPPTVEDVLAQLPNASIFHFACPIDQDDNDPLRIGLFLREGQLLQIRQVMEQQKSNAPFAYLAETRSWNEATALAESLLYCGFCGVVAQKW
jgi:hypothetical protein